LIAYAGQFGTTGEVAEAIGDTLSQEGHIVETQWVKNVKDIGEYDVVVIGSAIQYDKWMPEATDFVIANQNILAKLPVAYFFTCMTLSKRNEKTERQAMGYSDKLYSLAPDVKPVDIGRFAGAVDYSKMSFFLRLILGGILTVMGVKEGDYRDWDAIRTWARNIELKLVQKQL
jgi:menaquinone-dependent protoporphyrinogen oxidase